jgi:hypothetical protein
MKRIRILLPLAVLVLASLACEALAGGGSENPASTSEPGADQVEPATVAPTSSNDLGGNDGTKIQTDFLLTDDAFNITETGDGSLLYYTRMSQEDVLKFYREEYSGRDYTERELLTSISEGVFSIVFDGDPSGKALVIQSVDLGDGTRTVAIRLEDV